MATAELGINIVARNQAKSALKGLKSDIAGIQQSLGGMFKVAGGNLISAASIAGVRALKGAVGGVVGAFMDASNASAEFNAQISSIGAVAGASSQQLGELKQLALDLGVDPNLKVSAVEAAQAIEMLARNGVKVPQIMDGAAKATVLLANATKADFATAADIGTDAMAIFGIEAKDMMTAVDGIVSVTNNSKFAINDYALALSQGGGVAATVGVSFNDFNTTIAALASRFGSGSDAGTSFKTFLQRLVPSSKPAIAAMKELGLIVNGQNQFFDESTGQMKDMVDITDVLNRATKSLTEEQKIHYLSTIFGTDAMRAAAGIAALTGDEFKQLQETMGQTSAMENARKNVDNLAGDMEIFKSVIESTRIKVGDEFDDIRRDFYQTATGLVNQFGPGLVNFAGYIADGMEAAAARTRDYKAEFDKIFAEMGGDKLGGLLAGAAMLTGGKVKIDAEAQVLSVDWENFLDAGSLNFVYSRDAGIEHVDWESKTGKSNFTYDADAQIIDVNYNERLFNYYRDYKADVEIINVAWGTYTHNYDAGANIDETKVLWGAYTHNYDALATVSQDDVLWGIWTHSYNAKAEVGQNDIVWGLWTWTYGAGAEVKEKSVLWGAYSHTYDAAAEVIQDSVLWGTYTHTYDVAAQVAQSSVLWGAYTHIYDGFAKIGQDSVLWGLWTTTYSVGAQVSGDSVLWGLWTNTYDAKAEIGSSSVLWGAWTWTYGAGASIAQDAVDWGPWSNIYDAAVNIDWPEVPAIFKWLFGWENEGGTPTPSNTSRGRSGGGSGANTNPNAGGGGSRGFGNNASGTNFWEGGWTWVGEQGPELLNLPRGSRIMSNPDSKKMIGQLAQGTGTPTGGIFDGLTQTLGFLASAFGSLTAQQEDLKESVAQNTDAVTTAADMQQMAAQTAQSAAATNASTLKTAGDLIRVSAQQFAMAATQSGSFVLNGVAHFTDSFQELLSNFGDNLEGALQNVPGLFGASQVTGDQMRMAELGIPQNFADDWLRRLTDEVVNGVDWDNVDIQDAAKRAGIDPNLPADAILELVTKAWNDRSLFADKANLDLFNVDAIQAELMRQQASQAGTANIMALFGVSEDQVTQAGVSAGKQVRAGVTQGLQTSAEGDGTFANSVIGEVTPEQFAPVGITAIDGIVAEINKEENSAKVIDALGAVFSDIKSYGDVFIDASRGILNAIAQGFGESGDIDMVGRLAGAMRKNLELESSINALKNFGERVLEYVFQGYSEAAKEKNWPGATVGEAAAGAADTATGTGNAIGTRNWRGGLSWVGETGPELVALPRGSRIFSPNESMALAGGGGVNVTVNVGTVANDVDIQRLAYQIADIVQRRRQR